LRHQPPDPQEVKLVIAFLEKHTQYWKSNFVKDLARSNRLLLEILDATLSRRYWLELGDEEKIRLSVNAERRAIEAFQREFK